MSRRDFFEQERRKKMMMTFTLAVGLAIVTFVTVFVMYSKKLEDDAEANLLAITQENENIVSNEEIEQASFSNDKTMQNVNFEMNTVGVELDRSNEIQNEVKNEVKSVESKEPVSPIVKEDKENHVEEPKQENKVEENITEEKIEDKSEKEVELNFCAPVSGEIIKDYAMDTLVYSETLDEWCTHSGIDIKADKTSIVVAAEKGIVESIKNDPRYGLTIIISHGNNFKTVYSNLLTTEFVKEGEEVEKGQTIATVGETASFEIADECHLHFEMCKDGITVNPTIYFE